METAIIKIKILTKLDKNIMRIIFTFELHCRNIDDLDTGEEYVSHFLATIRVSER